MDHKYIEKCKADIVAAEKAAKKATERFEKAKTAVADAEGKMWAAHAAWNSTMSTLHAAENGYSPDGSDE